MDTMKDIGIDQTNSTNNYTFKKVVQGKPYTKKNYVLKNIFRSLAIISLLAAFIIGKTWNRIDYHSFLSEKLHNTNLLKIDEQTYYYEDSDHTLTYFPLGKERGYGGALTVATNINNEGIIDNIIVMEHNETVSFFNKITNRGFFKQFIGRNISDALIEDQDIDIISGATISSVAFAKAIRTSSHKIGIDYYGFSYPVESVIYSLGIKDLLLFILFALSIWAIYSGKKSIRYMALGLSLVSLGFYFNSALSISHFGGLLLGQLPSFHSSIFIWLLLFGTIGFAFITKKNVYCHSMCPFHAVEVILVKIGGFKISFPKKLQKPIRNTSNMLLWSSLLIIFLADNPTIAAFEPFAMIFGLEGVGIQWYILPAVLVGILFITDFFCRYFCPVGRSFKYIIEIRRWIDRNLISRSYPILKKNKK